MSSFTLSDGEELPVEGRDYTIEDGLLVFTRGYHLRRGICCGSGCRHCPFGQVAGRTIAVESSEDGG